MEDITERKRAQDALRESESRFRIMADSCPTPMWVTDVTGEVAFVNLAYQEFFGVNYQKLQDSGWRPLVHPDDAPHYTEVFQRSVEEHAPFQAEARVRSAGGEWRWVSSYAEPRFSAAAEFLGHVGLSPDITDRRRAEDALRHSEEKFRQFAENIRDAFWMVNPSSTEILYISPAYEQIWGRSCESLYRSPRAWMEAIHSDDRTQAHASFERQIAGEPVDSETGYKPRTEAKDGSAIAHSRFTIRPAS